MAKPDDAVRVHTDKHGNVDFTKYRPQMYELFDKKVKKQAASNSASATPPAKQVQRDDVGRKR